MKHVQVIKLTGELDKLALEQIHDVLARDLHEAKRLEHAAVMAYRRADARYVGSVMRLAKAADPTLELPEGAELRGDVEKGEITITLPDGHLCGDAACDELTPEKRRALANARARGRRKRAEG